MSVPANPHMGTSPRDTWALSLGTANVTLLTPQPSLEIVYKYVDWMGKLPRADLPCLNQDGIWIWLPAPWYNLSWREAEQRDISMMMGTLHSLFKKTKQKKTGYTTPICQSISTDRDLCVTLVRHVNQDNSTKFTTFSMWEWISSAPANADISTLVTSAREMVEVLSGSILSTERPGSGIPQSVPHIILILVVEVNGSPLLLITAWAKPCLSFLSYLPWERVRMLNFNLNCLIFTLILPRQFG